MLAQKKKRKSSMVENLRFLNLLLSIISMETAGVEPASKGSALQRLRV